MTDWSSSENRLKSVVIISPHVMRISLQPILLLNVHVAALQNNLNESDAKLHVAAFATPLKQGVYWLRIPLLHRPP